MKIKSIVLAVLCTITICGCNSNTDSDNSSKSAEITTEQTETTEVKNISLNEQSTFDFKLDVPKTDLRVDEKVTYTAHLINLTNENYTLNHGMSLISTYIYPEGDKPEIVQPSILITSDIKPNDEIKDIYNAQLQEAGNYILESSCWFELDGKDYYFKLDPIKLTVSD